MQSMGFGLRTWPQWNGWGICRQTGSLYDPHGNQYAPEYIAAAFMCLKANLHQDRIVWADSGERRRFTDVSDVPLHPRPIARERERRNQQHMQVLHLADEHLVY